MLSGLFLLYKSLNNYSKYGQNSHIIDKRAIDKSRIWFKVDIMLSFTMSFIFFGFALILTFGYWKVFFLSYL